MIPERDFVDYGVAAKGLTRARLQLPGVGSDILAQVRYYVLSRGIWPYRLGIAFKLFNALNPQITLVITL
jgi:hypothetical protein